MYIDKVKDELPFEFNKTIKSMLMAKAQNRIAELREGKVNDGNTSYLMDLFRFTGLQDIEKDEDELTGVTKNLHIARTIADQLENTRYNYQIEIVSLDEMDQDDDDDDIEYESKADELIVSGSGNHDGDGIDFDKYSETYDENSNDIFVVTVYLDSVNESNNPLKRSSQIGIVGGKRVRKLIKAAKKGFKMVGGKVSKQTSSEKINRKRGSRKAVLSGKGKQAIKIRKFKKSIKKSQKINNRQTRRA